MKLMNIGIAFWSVMFCFFAFSVDAQQNGEKAYALRGKVQQVDAGAKRITVSSEPIAGWMGTMTMGYGVDKEEVLNRVKAGDRITAKIYDGDFTLYDLQVLPRESAANPAARSGGGGFRLADLEQMALATNPTIAQAQANLRAAAGLARQAGFYPNPTAGYYGDEIRGGFSGGGKQGGFISQTIVMGGKLRAARRVAELQADEVETTGEVQRLRIVNNVRALFYRVLAAQRLVEVRGNMAKLAGDATQTSLQLGNVGQADRPDILQAEVEQQQANVSLQAAERDLQASWRILAAVVGKPGMPPVALEGDLDAIPDLNYDEWVATTVRESPEIKLAQQAVESAEASLVQARKAPIPDLQITGILAQNNTPLLESNPSRATGVQGGAQIGVQLPIFNRNQGNVAAARGEIESAKQELERVKLQLQRGLAGMFQQYESARVTVQLYKTEMLPRAQEAYNLYRMNYQKMAAAYPQVLISQRTLFQLEGDYIQALENAWQSALEIRGFGLMDGLSAPIGPSMANAQPGSSGYAGPRSAAAPVQ